MSTTPKYSRLDPGQRREEILDAANALFAERGYDEVSIEDIASAAGVTRGLVHHYFGGRKQVYIALLERLGAYASNSSRAPSAPHPNQAGASETITPRRVLARPATPRLAWAPCDRRPAAPFHRAPRGAARRDPRVRGGRASASRRRVGAGGLVPQRGVRPHGRARPSRPQVPARVRRPRRRPSRRRRAQRGAVALRLGWRVGRHRRTREHRHAAGRASSGPTSRRRASWRPRSAASGSPRSASPSRAPGPTSPASAPSPGAWTAATW